MPRCARQAAFRKSWTAAFKSLVKALASVASSFSKSLISCLTAFVEASRTFDFTTTISVAVFV